MPRSHLIEIVDPDIAELESKFDDKRCALHAIHSLDALAGHMYQWLKRNNPAEVAADKDDTWYRERLAKQNADFSFVRDTAKAAKHVELIYGSPQVTNASQIEARGLGWGETSWDEGRWDSPLQVVVKTNDGHYHVVETFLRRARDFLVAEMSRLNIP